MVYYVTIGGIDYAWCYTLKQAKSVVSRLGKIKTGSKHNPRISIDAYNGTQHGDGGAFRYLLDFDKKKFKKVPYDDARARLWVLNDMYIERIV